MSVQIDKKENNETVQPKTVEKVIDKKEDDETLQPKTAEKVTEQKADKVSEQVRTEQPETTVKTEDDIKIEKNAGCCDEKKDEAQESRETKYEKECKTTSKECFLDKIQEEIKKLSPMDNFLMGALFAVGLFLLIKFLTFAFGGCSNELYKYKDLHQTIQVVSNSEDTKLDKRDIVFDKGDKYLRLVIKLDD